MVKPFKENTQTKKFANFFVKLDPAQIAADNALKRRVCEEAQTATTAKKAKHGEEKENDANDLPKPSSVDTSSSWVAQLADTVSKKQEEGGKGTGKGNGKACFVEDSEMRGMQRTVSDHYLLAMAVKHDLDAVEHVVQAHVTEVGTAAAPVPLTTRYLYQAQGDSEAELTAKDFEGLKIKPRFQVAIVPWATPRQMAQAQFNYFKPYYTYNGIKSTKSTSSATWRMVNIDCAGCFQAGGESWKTWTQNTRENQGGRFLTHLEGHFSQKKNFCCRFCARSYARIDTRTHHEKKTCRKNPASEAFEADKA